MKALMKKIAKAVTALMMVLVLVIPAVYPPERAEAAETADTGGFYYNLLNAKEKEVYKQIQSQIVRYPNKGADLDTKLSADQCYQVAEFFLYDNPQLYWLYQDISVYHAADRVCFVEYASVDCNEAMFQDFAAKIIEEADCYAEDYYRIRAVYEAIVKNVSYDRNADNIFFNQTTYSAATGKSVCLGMSKMFMYCLAKMGYESVIVLTDTHAFNHVKLDGKWYIADVTMDGLYDKETDKVSFKYFMLGKNSAGYLKEEYLYTYPALAAKDFVKEAAYKKLTGKKQYTAWSEWEYRLESQVGTVDADLIEEQPVSLFFWYCFGDPSKYSSPYWNIWKNGRFLTAADYHEYYIELDFTRYTGTGYYVNSNFNFLDYSGKALVREAASNHQFYTTEVQGVRIFPHNTRQVVQAYKVRTRERVEE